MKNASIIDGRRVASDRIAELGENEIFVFGSNIQGAHGGGAAWFAHKTFGAEWGVGEGLTGRTYALPTMEGEASLKNAVEHFIACAKQHPELTFLVTAVGCGIAGYTPKEVAPLFKEATSLENVYLPQVFWEFL
jgi:O-acetyl-ADP-ribose deacetylase (regulator of RNase III)